jgi:hypothetical protein
MEMALKIKQRGKGAEAARTFPTLASGRDTGALYLMLDKNRGVILEGHTGFQGCEGAIVNPNEGSGVNYAPAGAVFEFEVL